MAQSFPVQHTLKGTLNLDLDPSEVTGGNYIGAKDVQFIGRGSEGTVPISLLLRNRFAAGIGSVPTQRKVVRMFFDLNVPYVMRFRSPSGDGVLLSGSLSAGVPIADININHSSYSAAASFIQGTFSNLYVLNVSVVAGPNYVDIDLIAFFTLDWSLVSVGSNVFTTTIIQEAIPINYSGALLAIGGYDLLGDLFVFSTPQENMPLTLSGTLLSGNGNLIRVNFSQPHALVTGSEIFISSGLNGVRGYWIVNVVSPSAVDLRFSNFALLPTGSVGSVCDAVLHSRGVGEIGVAREDNATGVWTYTRLLRSVEFGFTTQRQVEVQAEVKPLGRAIYFHQIKYNVPRVFYYRGDYVQDGALRFVSSQNQYAYGSIDGETSNQQSILEGDLVLDSQDVGGSLRPGNKQYFLRMVGQEGALFTTEPFAFTGLVNVSILSSISDPQGIVGGEGNISTGRINILRATGLRSDLYDFVELCVVEWFGSAFVASVVRRERLSGPDITLIHSGSEVTVPLATSELNLLYPLIANVGSARIIDNRLTYYDIDYKIDLDLSSWASSMTHQVIKYPTTTTGLVGAFQSGGFLEAKETVRFLGYSWYETHRFGVRVYWRDGGRSQVYWVDDVKFDINSSNVSLPNRRTGAPANYDLRGVGTGDVTFVLGVSFTFSLDFLVDGRPIRDLVSRIEFMRVDLNDNPAYREVLFSGMGIVGVRGFFRQGNRVVGQPINLPNLLPGVYPFLFFSGQNKYNLSSGAPTFPYRNMITTRGQDSTNNGLEEKVLFVVSNDLTFGGGAPAFVPGDRLINFGIPRTFDGQQIGGGSIDNFIRDFSLQDLGVGQFTPSVQPFVHPLRDGIFMGANTSARMQVLNAQQIVQLRDLFTNATSNDTGTAPTGSSPNEITYEFVPAFAVSLDNPGGWFNPYAPNVTTYQQKDPSGINLINPTEGVFYVSYYRERPYNATNPDASKFGNRIDSRYTTTAAYYNVPRNLFGSASVQVFGGDTFTTRVQHKLWTHLDVVPTPNDFRDGNYAMSFVSQSYVNPLMRSADLQAPNAAFPAYPLGNYSLWLSNNFPDQTSYNRGYSYQKVVQSFGYKVPDVDDVKFPTLAIWSDLTPEGSLIDAYRNFLPLNRKELDRNYGRIVHAEVVNGDLFILQERRWTREFFNTTGMVSADPDDTIALGNTGVMARRGVGLSSYGTRHKWSVIRGRLVSGADCVMWMDVENGVILRYGGDGTRNVSLVGGVDQFFKENSRWIFDFDRPAAGRGVCGVWNERFKEFRWAVRGYRRPDIAVWGPRVNILAGQTVQVPGFGYDDIVLKECILEHESSTLTNPINGSLRDDYWRVIPYSDSNHFNIYSLVYSEVKNGFVSFITPVPRIMLPWRSDYLTQKYGLFANKPLFLENSGLSGWYDVDGSPLDADGEIECVINYNSDMAKEFTAVILDSDVRPYRVEFRTPSHYSFVDGVDFEFREGLWFAPIKNDVLTAPNGTPDEDTTRLFGRWVRVKVIFERGVNQKVRILRVRLAFNSRFNQT